jgi:ferric-dicitrate binding protein FerR (iron transport regulator)
MNALPPTARPDPPPRRHWSRHLVRLIAFAAMVAIVAYLYSQGAR